MLADMLKSVLNELNGSSTGILKFSAIISIDGSMMASLMPQGFDEDRMGAYERRCSRRSPFQELGLRQVIPIVQGSTGRRCSSPAGEESVITVKLQPNAKLGLDFPR